MVIDELSLHSLLNLNNQFGYLNSAIMTLWDKIYTIKYSYKISRLSHKILDIIEFQLDSERVIDRA
ncbi:hypothetical protein V1477_004987 [Vespula maculifrons]|uniref:Uncharacterized protein n=1 Tax=Vespula maculifrons TaxID=7453 RepID=A0ABD2CNG8_VESMC